ncbi:glycosyltransferase family 4 protein [Spirosoma sp. RP8]|uniref:Glycosyltransferase family 4 protein n=1 Tax=Spirosoma liriopis TaxID=2937440 RepID=A0ABT0HLW8_9BACT|nr:glycosyltransferase family 1 protein [Spirosoma liriopis]MCK8493170.1 glycosyltransferase family 4 protein [Spirosoma liriopis]
MTVTYLSRSPGTGHSIEKLFGAIRRELEKDPSISVEHIRLPFISRGLRSVWQNLRFIARQRFSGLVHVTGDAHYAVLALSRWRTLLTVHDCITLEKNRHNPLRYGLFWLFWFYLPVRHAAVVTVVSEKSRRDLVRYLGKVAKKAVVVSNAYDPRFVYHAQSFRKQRPVLLQIGTAPHKNVSRLLESIEGVPCLLSIVGPLSEDLVRALRDRQILYQNYVNVSQDDMLALYVASDIVTFVSTYEGFGMPILEANAVGRVVLTADRLPMRDVAGKAAHLVDPDDSIAIRSGIQRLIDDDLYRQQLIEEGLRNAATYSAPTAATRYLSIYQQLANTRCEAGDVCE